MKGKGANTTIIAIIMVVIMVSGIVLNMKGVMDIEEFKDLVLYTIALGSPLAAFLAKDKDKTHTNVDG